MKLKSPLLWIAGSILLFILIGFAYASPVLNGKALFQHDIVQYRGGAEEMLQYREKFGKETYWTDSMFGGMPTFQTGARFPGDIIKNADNLLMSFPKPVNYLVALFAGFFLLGMVTLRNWKYALLGATFFGMSTYFYIIIAAGHNGKVHTIAYFAPLLAGVILLYFRRKYTAGFIVTAIALALQLSANHPQMTYYLFMALGVLFLSEIIRTARLHKDWKHFAKATGLMAAACLFAVGMNAQRLMANKEYVKATVRGEKILPAENGADDAHGMDKESILNWSYGKFETLNLMVPRLMGGGSNEAGTEKTMEKVQSWVQDNVQTQEQMNRIAQGFGSLGYWGDQPGTSGPAYQGAVVVFLGILGLVFAHRKYRYWILGSVVLSILLAWGKNFLWLSDLFIDFVPLYNKFRAPSSILVIPELLLPLAAILGLYRLLSQTDMPASMKTRRLLITSGSVLGVLLLLLAGGSMLDFSTDAEKQFLPDGLLTIITDGRKSMYYTDLAVTVFFVIALSALLYFGIQKKIKKEWVLLLIGILSFSDLWTVNKRYLNNSNFIDKSIAENPFITEKSDYLEEKVAQNPELQSILASAPVNATLQNIRTADPSHYRIFNQTLPTFNETNTSYFGSSVGGYHAVKLRRYDDMINAYFYTEDPAMRSAAAEMLNMLNTRYILSGDVSQPQVIKNPEANGNAWFVSEIKTVQTPKEELLQSGKVSTKTTAILHQEESKKAGIQASQNATGSKIQMLSYLPNEITYLAETPQKALAVFSEIYYPYGWKAFIDDKETDILRANYLLRALPVPQGKHKIKFVFEPESLQTGKTVSLASTLLFVLAAGALLFFEYKKRNLRKTS